MPRSNKVALTCIFGLGIFDIGVGVGRLITILQVDETDFTWSEVPALEWLAIEPSIAIVVSCMCVCRPLLEKLLPRSWRLTAGSSHTTEDHMKLVNRKPSVHHYSAGISSGQGKEGTLINLKELKEAPNGGIQVRKEFVVTATDHF